MSRAERGFLSRWSRLKHAGGDRPAVPAPAAEPLPSLPDLETLAFDDDFSGFLRQEVTEGVRRLALKKLFHAEQFNVIDPLDIYIDDYTVASPLDAATLRTMRHARELLLTEPEATDAAAASADATADAADAPAALPAATDATDATDVTNSAEAPDAA